VRPGSNQVEHPLILEVAGRERHQDKGAPGEQDELQKWMHVENPLLTRVSVCGSIP
jgi:hypothetical protein